MSSLSFIHTPIGVLSAINASGVPRVQAVRLLLIRMLIMVVLRNRPSDWRRSVCLYHVYHFQKRSAVESIQELSGVGYCAILPVPNTHDIRTWRFQRRAREKSCALTRCNARAGVTVCHRNGHRRNRQPQRLAVWSRCCHMANRPSAGLSAPDHPHAMVGVFPYQSFLSHDELPTGRLERSKYRAADAGKGCVGLSSSGVMARLLLRSITAQSPAG